jgi:hypothetical protein
MLPTNSTHAARWSTVFTLKVTARLRSGTEDVMLLLSEKECAVVRTAEGELYRDFKLS